MKRDTSVNNEIVNIVEMHKKNSLFTSDKHYL